MTLNEVTALAAGMTAADRWALFTACGPHDVRNLPRTTTSREGGPQYYCRSCYTIFGGGTFRMWNPPVRPRAEPSITAGEMSDRP